MVIFRVLYRTGNPILTKPDATCSSGRIELAQFFFGADRFAVSFRLGFDTFGSGSD